MHKSGPGGGLYLLPRRALPTQGDILRHRHIEKHDVLAHQGHELPQVGISYLPQIHSIYPDHPLDRIEKPEQQVHQGTLAGAALASHPQPGAARNLQAQFAQHRFPTIAEAYLVKNNAAFKLQQPPGRRRLLDRRPFRHDLQQPLHPKGGLFKHHVQLRHLFDRSIKENQARQKTHHVRHWPILVGNVNYQQAKPHH